MARLEALESYYEKFDEDHRLETRHGTVEFTTSMKYIRDFLPRGAKPRVLDVGAGTGRYSVALAREGCYVTAVEPVKRNLAVLRAKHENVNLWPGDARDLGFLEDSSFDITLLFGPLYHLARRDDKLRALSEAKRVTKKGGVIFAAYVMNEYSVLEYCFKRGQIARCLEQKKLTRDFHTVPSDDELYSYSRLEDIDSLDKSAGLERIKIVASDGPADYMRRELNAMDSETFKRFIDWHLATCERPDLLGASAHTVDILRNP